MSDSDQVTNSSAATEADNILAGGDDYSEARAMDYMLRFMDATKIDSPVAYRFCSSFERSFPEIDGFPVGRWSEEDKKRKGGAFYKAESRPSRDPVDPKDWALIRKHLEERRDAAGQDLPKPVTYQNLERLAGFLDLGQDEQDLIAYLSVLREHDDLRKFTRHIVRELAGNFGAPLDSRVIGTLAAQFLGKPEQFKKYTNFLDPHGPLTKYGLFYYEDREMPMIDYSLWDDMSQAEMSDEALIGKILGKPAVTDLDLEDFEYMGPELEFMVEMMRNAIAKGEKGVNILIYGPAGGGKTELAKAIGKALGVKVYSVGEENPNSGDAGYTETMVDEDGDVMGQTRYNENGGGTNSQQRMAQLQRTQELLKGNKDALAFFDEIEDLLKKGTDSEKAADTESKIEVNRLLENNPVPTIWAGNDPEKFHEAVRQRFTFSMYVGHPPVAVRRNVWKKQFAVQNVDCAALGITEADINRLARKFDAAPRQIAKAAQAAQLTGMGVQAIEMTLPASSLITSGSRDAIYDDTAVSDEFSPALVSYAKPGSAALVEELIGKGNRKEKYALMARGKVGTGVSSLLRHMAEEMNANIREYSMQALTQGGPMISPAGLLKNVFAEAANSRSLLVLEDIECVVNNPEEFGQNWEDENRWQAGSGLLNVFKDCARRHKLPLVVTTSNDKVKLPESFSHLLSHKIALKPLDESHARETFCAYFGVDAPASLSGDQDLVFSDFANVHRQIDGYKEQPTPEELVVLINKQKSYRVDEPITGMGLDKIMAQQKRDAAAQQPS